MKNGWKSQFSSILNWLQRCIDTYLSDFKISVSGLWMGKSLVEKSLCIYTCRLDIHIHLLYYVYEYVYEYV